MRGPAPHEVLLQGALADGITGAPDDVEARIRWLVAHCLDPLGSAANGWDWLFRDPRDGRLWEQTFPLGSLHGPGPRRLAVIGADEAAGKYGHTNSGRQQASGDRQTVTEDENFP